MHPSVKAPVRSPWLAGLLLAGAWACSAQAANSLPVETQTGIIQLAASMNSMAVACGDLTPAALETQRQQQRAAALKDMGMSGANYDRQYEQFSKDFQKKWNQGSEAQKKQSCAQVKAMSKAAP